MVPRQAAEPSTPAHEKGGRVEKSESGGEHRCPQTTTCVFASGPSALPFSALDQGLEASYEAVLLMNGRSLPDGDFTFSVSPGSTEAKFRLNSKLTLGKLDRPGLPLERVGSLVADEVGLSEGSVMRPLWSVLSAELLEFDRVRRQAIVHFSSYPDPNDARIIVEHATCGLLDRVFLVQPKSPAPYDWSKNSTQILKAIGNPEIADPDPRSAEAMGLQMPKRRTKKQHDPLTVPAKILWDALTHQNSGAIVNRVEAQQAASYTAHAHGLNPSQEAAVAHCLEWPLTVIWGPPGTGKTKTLAAFVTCLARGAQESREPLRVLIAGPTYHAVLELVTRTVRMLRGDAHFNTRIYLGYSRSRRIPILDPQLATGPNAPQQFSFSNDSAVYQNCLSELQSDRPGIVIVGVTDRQARRFPLEVLNVDVGPVFDVVIIDETSQVSVSKAISALVGLKERSRLVVAGDHLQMPPITAIAPPVGAEYMVGSFQTYLTERFGVERCALNVNYRSGEAIVEFARSIGYPDDLVPNNPDVKIKFIDELPGRHEYPQGLPWSEGFRVALDPGKSTVTLLHDDESSSQGNLFEAQLVASLCWALRKTVSGVLDGAESSHSTPDKETFWRQVIGIVTPHRAQRALCIRELTALFPEEASLIDEAVDTVERFQGGERHIIIVTFAVGDVDIISGEESFLMQLERTNVAISRAMGKCIVVMPRSLASYVPEDQETLRTAVGLKVYIEDVCNRSKDIFITHSNGGRKGCVRYRG